MAKVRLIVELECPTGASMQDIQDYVSDAVASWRGGLEPPNDGNAYTGNPMWGLDRDTVRVSRPARVRKSNARWTLRPRYRS